MIVSGLRFAALAGVGALLVLPGADSLALWSVVCTSAAGLIAQVLRARTEDRRAERRYQHDKEERAEMRSELQKNTEVTLETNANVTGGGHRPGTGYENHLNELDGGE